MKTIDQYVRESEDHEIGAAFLLALYDQVKPANSGFAPEDVDRLRRRGFILKELAKGPHADMCRVGHELMPPTYRCKKTVHVKDLLSDAHYWEVTVGQDDRGVGAATTDIVVRALRMDCAYGSAAARACNRSRKATGLPVAGPIG
jgi:hypothetical protein